jgi:hypothetical protein
LNVWLWLRGITLSIGIKILSESLSQGKIGWQDFPHILYIIQNLYHIVKKYIFIFIFKSWFLQKDFEISKQTKISRSQTGWKDWMWSFCHLIWC